jgi:hypothetical protein
MGLFCVNFHFRTTDDAALSAALDRRGVTNYRVLPAKGGWTSLYEEQASEQDDTRIRDLAGSLSKDLRAPAISFMVHDSDIACYWLFDSGRLLDDYNSCPDYFAEEDNEPAGPSGGRPEVLLPFCRSGVSAEEIAAVLAEKELFAERIIERLADLVGIDRRRALADYNGIERGEDPDAGGFDDDGDDGGGGDGGAPSASLKARWAGQLSKIFTAASGNVAADPQATALVEAAARDDTDEIDRLLAAGVAIDAEAPASLPGRQPLAGLGQLFPQGVPKVVMTPLLSAIVNRKPAAAKLLLQRGADPNRVHPLFGAPTHVAVGQGDAELLRVLIDHGADLSVRDAHGRTPQDVLTAGRAAGEKLAQAKAMMQSLGGKVPPVFEQLAKATLPTEGWAACEQLLNSRS